MTFGLAGETVPTTQTFFDELHQKLELPRTHVAEIPVDHPHHDQKVRSGRAMANLLRAFWRRKLEPHIRKHPQSHGLLTMGKEAMNIGEVRDRIHQLHTPLEVTNDLMEVMDPTIIHALSSFYAKCVVLLERSQNPRGLLADFAISQELIKKRTKGSVLAQALSNESNDFLDITKSAFNAARQTHWSMFDVIPRVALDRYDHRLTTEEYRSLARNSISVIRPMATTHVAIFNTLRNMLQPGQDFYHVEPGESVPYKTEYFCIAQRQSRMTIELTREAMEQLYAKILDLRSNDEVDFSDPRVGCAGNEIIPAFHRWCFRIAESVGYFDVLMDKLDSRVRV